MEAVIVSTSMCLGVLIIIFIGLNLQKKSISSIKKPFMLLILAVAIYLLVNLFSELSEYVIKNDILSYISNIILYLCADFVQMAFLYNIIGLTKNYAKKGKKELQILAFATGVLRIILVIILFFTGQLFTIDNHLFKAGPLAFVPYIMTAIILVEFLALIVLSKKAFSKKQFIVVLIYEILPLPFVLVESFMNIYYLTGIAITAAVLVVYVLIQDSEFETQKIEQKVLQELSFKDFLTDLNNRRAYYERCATLKENSHVCVVFCDINGLKYTNDNFGHSAGDELIKKFAMLFIGEFGKENTYRIAGDEFVAIIEDQDKEKFISMMASFNKKIGDNQNIAACGYSYGLSKNIEELVTRAENSMYEDKNRNSPSNR